MIKLPYIDGYRRTHLDEWSKPSNAGELNYVISTILLEYLGSGPNYQAYNDVMGVLAGVQMELYRRSTAPYEDEKITENGDLEYPHKREEAKDV